MEKIATEFKIVEEPRKPLAMNPKKFALWLFMGTVIMVFASLTSAYIVKRADGGWREYALPEAFVYTTVIAVVASITAQGAYAAARRDQITLLRGLLIATLLLGIAFLYGQWMGWVQWVADRVHFTGGNTSESFGYVLTGLHAAHIISAVIFLAVVVAASFRYKVHSRQLSQLEMCITYWHFLGALWIYLYIFMLVYR